MSLYRNAVWFLNGIHQYTRKGYEAAAKGFDAQDLDVSVVGRSFMNSGIGRATAMAVAQRGGTVHMVCRNKERAEEAWEAIVNQTGNTVYVHIVDMEKTCKVWEFAEAFKQQHPALNVLVGVWSTRETNAEDLEKNFATKTMGVYILTVTLIPLLEKSQDPRVITVSSGGMLVQKLRADDLQSEGFFDGIVVYAQNKVVLAQHWAKANRLIHFSLMHPGWVDTLAVSKSMPQFHRMMGERLRCVEQGADTVVWLALSKAAIKTPRGQFFQGQWVPFFDRVGQNPDPGRKKAFTKAGRWPERRPVSTHLPLAWTRSSAEDIQAFIAQLDASAAGVRSQQDPEADAHGKLATPQTASNGMSRITFDPSV